VWVLRTHTTLKIGVLSSQPEQLPSGLLSIYPFWTTPYEERFKILGEAARINEALRPTVSLALLLGLAPTEA
jgi:hypothetical protein